jgi:hypothetical protein
MFVYAPHKKANHTMFVSPAADPRVKGEKPSDWVDDENKPLTFTVEFKRGKAEVDDKVGKYMIEFDLARKSKIILPQDDD